MRQGVRDLFGRHAEVQTHGSRREGVGRIVRPDELRLHLLPLAAFRPPAQFEERGAAHRLAFHAVALAGQAVGLGGQSCGNAVQMFVVGIQENAAAGLAAQVVVEFAFGVHHALE